MTGKADGYRVEMPRQMGTRHAQMLLSRSPERERHTQYVMAILERCVYARDGKFRAVVVAVQLRVTCCFRDMGQRIRLG